ncbi:MAG: endonuclease III [Gemmatimonadota bacterium]|nr:endonuclease III [Gemmatimonadota bacterium]
MERLAELYPDAKCSLDWTTPLDLLVATVLSAQCTDARVNQVTPGLFARYRTAAEYAAAAPDEMEQAIRSVNFFRNKARALIGIGRALEERHAGEVPGKMDALLALPGVGRKTANLVRGVVFGATEGVVVDTHVTRISRRLKLTRHEDPDRIERDLLPLIAPEGRIVFTDRVIAHGRSVCDARRPLCASCSLSDLCPTYARAAA